MDPEYELARSSVGEDDYYYLAQVTNRSYNPHRSELVVKDFGLEWSYDVLEPDTVAIQQVTEKQRRQDFRAGRDPVEYLTETQATDVAQWYQDREDWPYILSVNLIGGIQMGFISSTGTWSLVSTNKNYCREVTLILSRNGNGE